MAAGWAIVQLTPLAGAVVQDPAPVRFGVGLAGFLMAGLAIAVFAMHLIDERFAHWLALLFVMRGLAAPGQVVSDAVRGGLGAAGGSVLAMLFLMLNAPVSQLLAIAGVMFLIGLRMLPHPGPYSAAAFSVSILLATAPSQHAALVRIEAAILAVLLSTVVATVLSAIWSAIERVQASRSTSSGS